MRSVALDEQSTIGRCRAHAPLLLEWHFFSHLTAAALHGMPLPERFCFNEPLHVAVLGGARPRGRGVLGHELSDTRLRTSDHFGLPVIAPADTWCHLASILDFEDLVAVGDFLISGRRTDIGREEPLATFAELRDAVARRPRTRGVRDLRLALPLLRDKVDSRPETILRLQLIAAGLPEPLIASPTPVDDGELILHPDLKYEQWRIVFEYEGDGHRTDKKRFRRDIARREKLEAANWRVIRVTADDVSPFGRAAFIARVFRILATRS